MRLLALGGVAGPILFSTVVIVSEALKEQYSHTVNFISELGAAGAPYAALMNYAGFLPGGLMLAAFGVALAKALPRRPVATLAVRIAPIAFLCLCLLAALAGSLDSRALTGLWQRLLLAVLFAWCAVVGMRAFRHPASHRSPP